ncbi:MAG: hypothetical protein WA869_29425 [Alloacidobacterium sp.]
MKVRAAAGRHSAQSKQMALVLTEAEEIVPEMQQAKFALPLFGREGL